MSSLHRIGRQALHNATVLYVSGAELAEVFGVQKSTLYHYETDLAMPKIKRDLYDLKKCCKWYIEKIKEEANAASNEQLNEQRIALTKAKAKKAEIENELLSGSTVQLKSVSDDLIIVIGSLKDSLYNLAGVLSNDIANITEPAVAYNLIEEAVADALNEAADNFMRIAKGGKDV